MFGLKQPSPSPPAWCNIIKHARTKLTLVYVNVWPHEIILILPIWNFFKDILPEVEWSVKSDKAHLGYLKLTNIPCTCLDMISNFDWPVTYY